MGCSTRSIGDSVGPWRTSAGQRPPRRCGAPIRPRSPYRPSPSSGRTSTSSTPTRSSGSTSPGGVDAGAVVRGHKVGLSSKAMQEMMGVDEPDYGHLLDDMFVLRGTTPCDGPVLPAASRDRGGVRARRRRSPGPGVHGRRRGAGDGLRAARRSRSSTAGSLDWKIKIQRHHRRQRVVGGARPRCPAHAAWTTSTSALIGAALRSNGEIVETGAVGAVLGNPATAVAWLANKLAQFGVRARAWAGDHARLAAPGWCPSPPGDVDPRRFRRARPRQRAVRVNRPGRSRACGPR